MAIAPGLGMEKARPRPGASWMSGLPGGVSGAALRSATLRAPTATEYRPRAKIGLPPDRSPGTGDPDCSPPQPHRARPRPTCGGPGGVAKGRSREPRGGAARRHRRLVSPGQSSAAASRPQTPSGATGTAPLAAAEAATGPPPPPSASSSTTASSPWRRTWRDPDLTLARRYSPHHARSRKARSPGGGRKT